MLPKSKDSSASADGFQKPPRHKRGMMRWSMRFIAVFCVSIAGYFLWQYHGPADPVEIYRGITYACERLSDTPESGGLMHWVRADLKVPGVQLYITPLDPGAKARGWEYRLKYTSTAVADEHLAAAVNGTLFASDSTWIRLSGDDARSNETIVADHVVNHVHLHTYLLWWDDDLLAHLESTKPPSAQVLTKAKWGIGGQQALLMDGVVSMHAGRAVDQRTMIAADPQHRIVWIACFDKASYRFAAQNLADKGAKIGIMVDGGSSTSMAIGDLAVGVRSGTVRGNWRPVATHFGFRADPIQKNF
jgi:hypothetical protein